MHTSSGSIPGGVRGGAAWAVGRRRVDRFGAAGSLARSGSTGRVSHVQYGVRCCSLRALQLDECTERLVVGVSLVLAPGVGTSFALAGMTSARGRSHMFDARGRADGYARGEACGAVIELFCRAPFSTQTILAACASAYLQMTLLLFIMSCDSCNASAPQFQSLQRSMFVTKVLCYKHCNSLQCL